MEAITSNSYLTFKLSQEIFSVNVSQVREILEMPKITSVPQSPEYMKGVINLRGSVLPVIDTRIKFGLPVSEQTIETCVIVMEVLMGDEEIVVGAIVDRVLDVLEIIPEKINASPSLGTKYKSEFIQGMGKLDNDQFVMILNINEVFSTDEKTILKDGN